MKHSLPLPEELLEESRQKWDAFNAAAAAAEVSLPKDPEFLETLKTVFVYSDFFAHGVTQSPQVLCDLMETGDLERKYQRDEYTGKLEKFLFSPTSPQDENHLSELLRRFRFREMLRIAWRDLSEQADLDETMADLSNLADACLDHALAVLYDWQCSQWGVPYGSDGDRQHLIVIGMGKLGGRELNFSSDIDLIFSYPQSGETAAGPKIVGNEEFFTRLCRQLIRVIGATTSKGFVFRVDMRLRPYGESGPVVMSFDAMEAYYQSQGREWERYSWIKARVCAGDKEAGAQLIERLKPFVYRRYLDYSIFESLRDMKQKITLEVARKGMKDNIKLGPGGIREIEFFGQIFQLVRGGVTPVLQVPQILKVLSVLCREEYISTEVRDRLSQAYRFLRKTEHRLQEFSNQQTHQLPSDVNGKIRLAASMGFSEWDSFTARLNMHMEAVHSHFTMLLGPNGITSKDGLSTAGSAGGDEKDTDELADVWKGLKDHRKALEIFSLAGFENPENVTGILENLQSDPATRALSGEGLKRLDRLMPLVLKHAGGSERPDHVLNRIVDLIKTVQRRTTYLALLLENPSALIHLVKLAEASSWIVSFLARHPVLLDELLDPRTLYSPPQRREIENEIQERLSQIPSHDFESQIVALSIFKQINILRIAAADVTGVLPLMRVSDHLTEIGETVLTHVLDLAWKHLSSKHGVPEYLSKKGKGRMGFCIIAYGKLGGFELGYGSDLDLVFIHSGKEGQTRQGAQPIETPFFYSRLGQRIVHTLTSMTPAGVLYDCDMRLRPDGGSGILAVNLEAFRQYQMEKAWTWEHQALIKARAVCGDDDLRSAFEEIRNRVISLPRKKETLQKEIRDMRQRLRNENSMPGPDVFDIKQGAGGLVDIEFLVQYLVLLNAHQYPQLTRWTDIVRLLQTLAQTGIMAESTAGFIKETYLAYRSAVHKLSLQEKPAHVSEHTFDDLRSKVMEVWNELFEDL